MSELPKAEVIGVTASEQTLCCAACGHAVCSQRDAVEIGGSHVHTRLNPASVLFRFGCFALAPGVRVSGESSSEHVWFAGCRWQYAHCSACTAHLGWAFTGAETFFGLVLERLVES